MDNKYRSIKLFAVMVLAFFVSITIASAKRYEDIDSLLEGIVEKYETESHPVDYVYIIGNHVFTGSYAYTLKELNTASRTIPEGTDTYMYYVERTLDENLQPTGWNVEGAKDAYGSELKLNGPFTITLVDGVADPDFASYKETAKTGITTAFAELDPEVQELVEELKDAALDSIDIALNEDEVDEIVSSYNEIVDGIVGLWNDAKTLEAQQTAKKAELDALYEADKANYSDADKVALDKAYEAAKNAIKAAEDETAMDGAIQDYNDTKALLMTDEAKTAAALKTAKAEAIEALNRYEATLDETKYDKAELEKVLTKYTDEINAAEVDTMDEINDKLIEAVKAMEAARVQKEDSEITIDTVAETEDKTYIEENWGYVFDANDQLKSNYDANTKTLIFTGNVAHMPDVKETAFPDEAGRTGYYLAYTIHIPEEGNTDNLVITVTSPLGTKTYGKQGNGTLTVLNSINPTDYTTNGKVTITVDYDGEGELYGATNYYVDYTKVQLGKVSELNLDNFDVGSETYLKELYGWVKPENYLTFTADKDTNTVKVSGTLAPYSEKLKDEAGFAEGAEYFLGFRIPVKTASNENMKESTVVIKATGKQTTTITKTDFNNESDAFVLWMLDPKNTPKENRKITIVVDKDGEGNDYSETTYTLDWSDVKFSEVSKLNKISTNIPQTDSTFMRDEWGYEVNSDVTLNLSGGTYKYTAIGSVTEQPNVTAFDETESTGYYFAYNLLLNLDTELNGKLTEKDLKDIAITIKNSANGKTKTFGFNDLTIDENGNISLTMLTHINPDSETKEISISVDFDGDKDVFGAKNYHIDYSQLKLICKTSLTVNEVKAGSDAAKELETDFGYKVAEAGRITLNSNIDVNGNSTVYAHGFALPVKLSDNVFGEDKDNGYYLPLNIKISHASKIESITITNDSKNSVKTISGEKLADVKETGVLNALRLIADNNASKGSSQDTFTIGVKYASGTVYEGLSDQKITVDTSDVKLGAKGLYEVAYNTTMNTDYDIKELTNIKYGSDLDTAAPNEKDNLFKSVIMNILSVKYVKNEKVSEFNQDGNSTITLAVNPGYVNPLISDSFTGTRNDTNADGFFYNALKFTIVIDSDNHIVSIQTAKTLNSDEISTKNKYEVDELKYVVKSIDMNFTLSKFDKKTDVQVELTEGNTLPEKETSFKNKYLGQIDGGESGKSIKLGDSDFEVEKVYTKIGKVENTNVNSITVNGVEYNNKNVSISIDKNAFIVAPRFVIIDDELYVSTTHLMSFNKAEVTIVCDGVTYTVNTGIDESTIKELAIDKVSIAFGEESSENNSVSYDKDTNTITHKSNNGKNAIYIDLKYGEDQLKGTSNYIYSLSENGNMGITAMEEDHTYGAYTLVYGKTVTDADSYEQEETLIVPGKGSVTFKLKVVAVPAE